MKKMSRLNTVSLGLVFLFLMAIAPRAVAGDSPVEVTGQELEKTQSLQQREGAVSVREEELAERQKELELMEKEVNVKLEEVAVLQKEIEAKLAEIRTEQDAGFKNLIKVYSTMSSSKLAPLLNQMSDENVEKILRAMKADQVAQIIPKLETEKAVRVSRLLGRFE
ncbi:MAG: hypothetical protein V1706_16620 [Pseudomonadota bacterium]